MTKLQRIRQIIIKNDPSILDLVFGCEVKILKREMRRDLFSLDGEFQLPKEDCTATVLWYEDSYRIGDSEDYSDAVLEVQLNCAPVIGSVRVDLYKPEYNFNEEKDIEIIGRTITLADVLRAANQELLVNEDGLFLVFGMLTSGTGYYKVKSAYVSWNLADNNLNNQSKETISFIHKILI